jgi:plasmid stabilization system protein ParE
MRVVFAPQAREELLEGTDYYRDRSSQAADNFQIDVANAIDLLQQFPGAGSPISQSARRLRLRSFPYQFIYRVEGEDIRVYAVAHLKRKPRYWIDRLR